MVNKTSQEKRDTHHLSHSLVEDKKKLMSKMKIVEQ